MHFHVLALGQKPLLVSLEALPPSCAKFLLASMLVSYILKGPCPQRVFIYTWAPCLLSRPYVTRDQEIMLNGDSFYLTSIYDHT